ncbi:LPS export ABC transporter periplasmic protein LptC [Limnohabitans sp. Rim8]|uniref:LPS export ABC transporter periplasmic protein LptC n=1 Tax=Limnohabitans sp. Rim8 TaxID=1100718 RepID=UPI0025D1C57D|nr:LPS export ABC transporter periplasmic protein LptC [Limnohabitans sp. Rim8]
MKLRRLLDALSLYLPLIVVAMLASGSWWLVRSIPALSSPEANKPVRQEPDYRLSDFSVKSFNATGQMTREITGKKAQHFPATENLQIEEIRIFAQNDNGSRMSAQALQGVASDDGTQVTLVGQAQTIQHAQENRPQIELRGERLVALPDEDRVLSDDPVHITRGRDVFTANTMNFNSNTGEYVLQGRVRGTLMPTTTKP